MKNTCNPCCPTQESDLHVPLSASVPVAGANAGLGFVVRCQADGLSSVGVNGGLGKRGLTLSLPGERVPGSRVALLLLTSPSVAGGVVSSRAFFFFFFCLSLGVTDLFVWVAETKCVDCDRCFFEQLGEADHTADSCLVVRLPSAHLSFYSTFPFAPRMAPAASAVVLRVSFRLWVFLILFWLLVWSCWPFVLKKSVRTFGSPQWISLPCSAELILFLWLLTAVLVDIMEDVNKYA